MQDHHQGRVLFVAEKYPIFVLALRLLLVAMMVISPYGQCFSTRDCRCETCVIDADHGADQPCTVGNIAASGCCSRQVNLRHDANRNPVAPCCAGQVARSMAEIDDQVADRPTVANDECLCGCQQSLPPTDSKPAVAPHSSQTIESSDATSVVDWSFTNHRSVSNQEFFFNRSGPVFSANERCARFCRWLI
ncbi:MAG: hypothetical protein Q8M16_09230 [Pirellulaceae bacterium]|nr:hypothetical protein [Pirellulaceae bacterium]